MLITLHYSRTREPVHVDPGDVVLITQPAMDLPTYVQLRGIPQPLEVMESCETVLRMVNEVRGKASDETIERKVRDVLSQVVEEIERRLTR